MEAIQKYTVQENVCILEALVALNKLSSDSLTLFVLNAEGKMVGTLTDGDIRRKLIEEISLKASVSEVMNRSFSYLTINEKDAVWKIREYKHKGITLLPVLDEEKKIVRIYNLKKHYSVLPVDAVLMAGGKGERLRPLTEKTPKPLLPVGDKAIIDYNIERLIAYGIEHISVTVNYLKERIEEHFSQPFDFVKIDCVREPRFLGTMGSIKFVKKIYNDTVLVMNSDLFTNLDYEDFYLHFKKNEADMSVAAVPYPITVPYGIFDLNGRNILGIKEKPTYNYYANAGIYLIKKELLSFIPAEEFYNATDFIELLIKNKRKVVRFPITGYWLDIGKYEEYYKAQELVKHIH
ncbi:nucleotidyltransferase family protein [Parabacteroides pacaensis]|uniref:nucleotidyltransferase family protein n=1 Tax=Parabacteroides pacaensis TaxID=2086575 RepID=UPI000D0FBAB6|nr:nucleotidyltransferase family protein [Parabacteroides pacaensis]